MTGHTTSTVTGHPGPVFTPKCTCGWTGPAQPTADAAQNAAIMHATQAKGTR